MKDRPGLPDVKAVAGCRWYQARNRAFAQRGQDKTIDSQAALLDTKASAFRGYEQYGRDARYSRDERSGLATGNNEPSTRTWCYLAFGRE